MSIKDIDLLGAEAAAKALLELPEDEVLVAEKGDGLMSAKADVFMGWSKSPHPATTEVGEADVGSTSCQSSSYSLNYTPPTSPVSPPPSPELARVLDMAEVIRTYYHEDDDDITASFETMESDDAVEERTLLVESVEWARDGDDSVFDHEVDPLHSWKNAIPDRFKKVSWVWWLAGKTTPDVTLERLSWATL